MKRFAVLLALCLALSAHSYEKIVGTLTSAGATVNNTTTAVPFTPPTGSGVTLAVQCDAAACIRVGLGSGTTASCTAGNAAKGVVVAAGQLYDIPMASVGANAVDTIAMVSVSGTANCDVSLVVAGP